MTRAYDDIDAITRLLEEKEKDLELTVQIGKELLTQNNRLENRITELESDLKTSNEDRSQLVHELHQKTELISILTNDVDSESGKFIESISLNITRSHLPHRQHPSDVKIDHIRSSTEKDIYSSRREQIFENGSNGDR